MPSNYSLVLCRRWCWTTRPLWRVSRQDCQTALTSLNALPPALVHVSLPQLVIDDQRLCACVGCPARTGSSSGKSECNCSSFLPQLVVDDQRLWRVFRQDCYTFLPGDVPPPPHLAHLAGTPALPERNCVSDEHYVATLLAVYHRDNEVRGWEEWVNTYTRPCGLGRGLRERRGARSCVVMWRGWFDVHTYVGAGRVGVPG